MTEINPKNMVSFFVGLFFLLSGLIVSALIISAIFIPIEIKVSNKALIDFGIIVLSITIVLILVIGLNQIFTKSKQNLEE